ncbi:MAG: ribonuclease III [Alphaproteobacteria bacterium]|nr:ribonuclease III [Alphaproteobacteria bacterium]
MDKLEEILGYKFNNRKLLEHALTHGSVAHATANNYERLEFLGDRVLGVAVAEMLYKMFPNEPEGNLSQRFVALVCKESVAEVALKLNIDRFVHAEGVDVEKNDNVLCDVAEAVIGAMYLDAGSEKAIAFVQNHWEELVHKYSKPPKDAKTSLQELAHHFVWNMPVYEEIRREGKEHDPKFFIKVSITGHGFAIGEGHNKKAAEQDAAKKLLKELE